MQVFQRGNSQRAKTPPPTKVILTQRPRGVSSTLASRRRNLQVSTRLHEGEKSVSPSSSESSRILTSSTVSPTPKPDKDKYNGVWSRFQLIKSGIAESSGEIMFVLLAERYGLDAAVWFAKQWNLDCHRPHYAIFKAQCEYLGVPCP